MPMNANSPGAVAPRNASKKASTATRLLQAAALAAALVPLGSVAMEGSTLVCGFSGAPDGDCGEGFGGNLQTFDFVGYRLIMEFFDIDIPFTMTVTDTAITQEDFDVRNAVGGDYDCVSLVAPTLTDSGCRNFSFLSSAGKVWDRYEILYEWDFDTEMGGAGSFPNGTDPAGAVPGNVRVLQDPGTTDFYSIDMCLEAVAGTPNYIPCQYFAGLIDPGIRSGDTDFSDQIVAWTAVPEPGSLMLLGTGLAGILYRKRRR